MVAYVKKSGIKKPIWIGTPFPAFHGLLDAVLQKVKVQSKSNLCVGGFIERTAREATLYEQASTTCLLKTLEPMSRELVILRKNGAADLQKSDVQEISTTGEARSARRAVEQQAKAAELENKMLQQITLTENDIAEVYTKINIMLARFCKGSGFRVIAEEIPTLTPHVFNAQTVADSCGLHRGGDEAA